VLRDISSQHIKYMIRLAVDLHDCRCFAALGDVSKARYLHETNRIAEEAAKTMVNKPVHLLSYLIVS